MSAQNDTGQLSLLRTLMWIQFLAFLVYGITFFFMPDFTLRVLFGFSPNQLPPSAWVRVAGASFLGIAFIEFLVIQYLADRLDLVWPYVAIPALLLIAFIWERIVGTYVGSELFFWVSIVVTAFFFLSVGWARMRIKG